MKKQLHFLKIKVSLIEHFYLWHKMGKLRFFLILGKVGISFKSSEYLYASLIQAL